jgi:hypothetical protein
MRDLASALGSSREAHHGGDRITSIESNHQVLCANVSATKAVEISHVWTAPCWQGLFASSRRAGR